MSPECPPIQYKQGWDAYYQGVSPLKCPHPKKTFEWYRWHDGYKEAVVTDKTGIVGSGKEERCADIL